MKRQVEIEDTLDERVQNAIDEVQELLEQYIKDNPDDGVPDLYNDLDYSGSVHEIIDSSVPIYTGEIEDTWYLYGNELERAYDDAGIGSNPRESNGMAAIYFYIEQQVAEWYNDNAEDIYEELTESEEE